MACPLVYKFQILSYYQLISMENQAEKDLNIFHINMHTFP